VTGDREREILEQLQDAMAEGTPVCIAGGGTKGFLGGQPRGIPLDVSGHRGIISYEPKELVITARCGTPLAELESVLAGSGQMIGFEPPAFGEDATLGGTIAAGLSGPRRPYAGSARDFVLGVRMLNGRGQNLRFGGEVMKNVAGYDVSRLMTGAMGTLGVILEISLKVLPIPARETTLVQSRGASDALDAMVNWARSPLPLSAACSDGERLYVRLSGTASAVNAARKIIGGEPMEEGEAFWRDRIREQGHAFFGNAGPLWRISVPATATLEMLPGSWFMEWGGAQRWLRTDLQQKAVQTAAATAGGHATCFRGGDRQAGVYQPLSKSLMSLHRNLKQAFDPQGLFNPGRLHPDF